MNADVTSGERFAEVSPGDPLYRDLGLRGYNRRFVGAPDSVFVVYDTDQVVNAVNAAVASGKNLAVRSGGHCMEGLVADPTVRCVIDLGRMDSVSYDRHRRAFAVEAGATLGRVYQALDMSWGVILPGGSSTRVGRGGHVTGGGCGPLSRLCGQISDHLYAVETVVVDEDGEAKAVTATREEGDPHRDLWWARTPVAVAGTSVWQRNSRSVVGTGRATTRRSFCRNGLPATQWPR
jgi:FAD/FMN-containing dehydrogenase